MKQRVLIGKVTGINGQNITILMNSLTNLETIQYKGINYKGVYSNSLVGIIRGSNIIVCTVEKEVLTDTYANPTIQIYAKDRFKRELFVKIRGNIRDGKYTSTVEIFPMIFNDVILLEESKWDQILQLNNKPSKTNPDEGTNEQFNKLKLGETFFENFPVYRGINKLFNTHIGIFGTTGSGKSNTLAHLYRSLFKMLKEQKEWEDKVKQEQKQEEKEQNNKYRSHFVFFDFNDEYSKCFKDYHAKEIKLDDKLDNNKFPIPKKHFWDTQLFVALLNPSEKTQKPKFEKLIQDLEKETNPSNILKTIETTINPPPKQSLNNSNKTDNEKTDQNYKNLLKRFKKILETLFKVIEFTEEDKDHNGWQIFLLQFGNADLEMKKIVSLVIVKALYKKQKEQRKKEEITTTTHLIIDEAHNILSEKQINETEERKNYRLGSFEEIIKEGRKFNFFVTLSSQRPIDISSGLISQLHNFFIHRLVNEYDLKMIKNSISELDSVSHSKIPSLNPGQCVLSGVAFEHPTIIKVKELDAEYQPESRNEDLEKLWFDQLDKK